ncbi:hypothetical protein RJ641_006277 [Dillenia turbinata]|uniref:Uncharacterized protein n=1 Tax=Dillenia turbinata TaxID=194707 RepID=A0AAN8VD35_9MAGN
MDRSHTNGKHLKVVHRYGPCSYLDQHKTQVQDLTQILIQDQFSVKWINSRLDQKLGPRRLPSFSHYTSNKVGPPNRYRQLCCDRGPWDTQGRSHTCLRHRKRP